MRSRPLFSTSITLLFLACAAVVIAQVASPETAQLGTVDFPTSGSGEAQKAFIRGVLLLHSFEYEDAANQFRKAQDLDPSFAMAYWGEAMSYNHPIWMEQDRDAALAALQRLAPTAEARLAKAPTERERGYLQAVEILYGEGDKYSRDFAYRDAMRRMHEQYPDDMEAAAFYALSLLGTAHGGRDFGIYVRAASIAQPISDINPMHPGAAHYTIHSFDDPIHAPLGLPAAKSYSVIAPAAAHAQHMTSHIFVAMGMWDDVVRANIAARDVQNQGFVSKGQPERVCGHYPYWLEYGLLQQGRYEAATQVLRTCRDRVVAGGEPSELWHYSVMISRYIFDTMRFDEIDEWTVDFSDQHQQGIAYAFTRAFAGIKRGETEQAERIIGHLAGSSEQSRDRLQAEIYALELKAMLAIAKKNGDKAVELVTEASEMEEALPYMFGPPAVVKPTHELLGEMLLVLGRVEEAKTAFETSLARTPKRTASLLGMAKAAKALGDVATVAELHSQLRDIWHSADPDLAGLKEVVSSR